MKAIVQNESGREARRRHLFDLFSRNLDIVKRHPKITIRPTFNEGFICPICFKLFKRNALSTEYDDHLTLEDVPPKSLGGKIVTLTCKICNNRGGSELESHLSKKLRADAFLSGSSGVQMRARFRPDPSVDLTATVQFTPDRVVDIRYLPNQSDPGHIERLHKLEEAGDISSITIRFLMGYRMNRPEIALLRIAYLLAFARFGYGFLINDNLVCVRHQIRDFSEKILPNWGILRADYPDSAVGISVIHEPEELQSFLIVFDLETETGRTRHGIVLPGPTKPGLDVYERIAELERTRDCP